MDEIGGVGTGKWHSLPDDPIRLLLESRLAVHMSARVRENGEQEQPAPPIKNGLRRNS